ncbi:MAG: FkbM family methyltransferase [bacterium]
MSQLIKRLMPPKMKKKLENILFTRFGGYGIKSYSQEGEDMILRRIFEKQGGGFYVDVGAHHPKRFSNTYYFYKKGWRGINIDAAPGSMKYFSKFRKEDINLEIPVSDTIEILTYHMFDDPALNGFSKELSVERDKNSNYRIVKTIELKTSTLSEILDKYLPQNTVIDFLSIDVEGFDFKVLKSNDWEKYLPKIVLVEALQSSLEDLNKNEIVNFMKTNGYEIFAKSFNTFIFKLIKNE